jgi:hypothetical protein
MNKNEIAFTLRITKKTWKFAEDAMKGEFPNVPKWSKNGIANCLICEGIHELRRKQKKPGAWL